ncbi:hypothetical protein BGZ73_003032 [Actinomortierella ambigua]|nr:hypothetical protein BGZ73_003032 [Actinomortierella ambigua]
MNSSNRNQQSSQRASDQTSEWQQQKSSTHAQAQSTKKSSGGVCNDTSCDHKNCGLTGKKGQKEQQRCA